MVRIKHRYLLVHILYPDLPPTAHKAVGPPPKDTPPLIRFRQPTPNELTPQILLRSIREQVGSLYGDYGAGVTSGGLSVKYLSAATSTFILRCPRAHYQLVWASLTYMTHLPPLRMASAARQSASRTCVMKVVRVSGTIRKAEEEAVRRARSDILRARREGGGKGDGLLERMFGGEGADGLGGRGEEGWIVSGDEGGMEDVDRDEDEEEGEGEDGEEA